MSGFPNSIFRESSYLDYYQFTEDFIFENIGSNKRILDIGCRDGLFTERIYKRTNAKEIIGLDISSKVIQDANLMNSFSTIKYYCDDGENFQFLEKFGRFDIIHIRNTFHHFYKPNRFIENITHLLNKNGKLIIVDVDYESFIFNLGRISLGELQTWLTIYKTIGFNKGAIAIKKAAFYSLIYRRHHSEDVLRQKANGWYKSKEIFLNLKSILPNFLYGRLGGSFGIGGVYYVLYENEGV